MAPFSLRISNFFILKIYHDEAYVYDALMLKDNICLKARAIQLVHDSVLPLAF